MTTPIAENVRGAASAALQELAQRCMRSAATLIKQSAYLLHDDPKVHHRVVSNLRRQVGFQMPGHDKITAIEAALVGGTEAECRATAEARRIAKAKAAERTRQELRDWRIKSGLPGGYNFKRAKEGVDALQRNADDLMRIMTLMEADAFDGCPGLEDFAEAITDDFPKIAEGIRTFLWDAQAIVNERFPPAENEAAEGERPDVRDALRVIDGGQL